MTRLELRIPAYMQIKTPKTMFQAGPPPAPSTVGPKLMGFVYYTWQTNTPTDHSITAVTASPHRRGYNYDSVWRPFFLGRGLSVGQWSTTNADDNTDHVWEYSLNNSTGALVNDGAGNSTRYVQLRGTAVFHYASALDYFCAGHGYGAGHAATIRALSNVGTRCGIGFFNYESINQGVQFNPYLETVRMSARLHPLTAETTDCAEGAAQPNKNTYRCTAIDKYEDSGLIGSLCTGSYPAGMVACPHDAGRHAGLPANATVFTHHTWECDVRERDLSADIIGTLGSMDALMQTTGNTYDWQLWDNCIEDPYLSAAKNNFPAAYTSAAYRGSRSVSAAERTGWKGHLQNLQDLYASKPADFIWANTYGYRTNAYSVQDIRNRWCEGFFLADGTTALDTLVNVKQRILNAKNDGALICINAQADSNAAAWGTGAGPGGIYGTWAQLFDYINSIDAWSNVAVMVGRDSNAMFHQTGMRTPV
jgi:hypothetical protein